MLALTRLFSDSFARPNENPLFDAGSWAAFPGLQQLEVVNNQAVCSITTDSCGNYYTGSLPNNQFAEVTFSTWGINASLDLLTRARTSDFNSGYHVAAASVGPGSSPYGLYVNNTLLSSSNSATFAAGDTLLLAAFGTTIQFYRNGSLVVQVTDSTLSSGTVGLGGLALAPIGFTNFNAGSLPPTNYSVPDCRTFGNFPNNAINVNGTETFTVPSVDSRKAGPPVDSRTNKPVDSRAAGQVPQNSRTPGVFGPGE